MEINLYSTNKRENSTYIPSGTGITREVVLKDKTSMLNPTFLLNWNNNNPTIYNYCYCNHFARYYFIRDWVFDGRMWEAVCESDVMSSFKIPILASELYVLRSASEFDPKIIETMYPAKTEPKFANGSDGDLGFVPPWNPTYGSYVLGSLTRDTSTVSPTGITYYVLDANLVNQARNRLYPDLTSVLDNQDELADIPGLLLQNPSQFIASLMWFPFEPSVALIGTSGNPASLVLGYYRLIDGLINLKICNSLNYERSTTISFYRPSTTRGDWQKLTPFCEYYINVPYFGLFTIPSEIAAYHDIRVDINVSIPTGLATLKVYQYATTQDPSNSPKPFIVTHNQIGQPFQLTGIAENWGGMIQGNLDMLSGIVGSATGGGIVAGLKGNESSTLSGNQMGSILQFANGAIKSACAVFEKTAVSNGTAGGTTESSYYITSYTKYYDPTEDDNANFGKPLCKKKRIGDLSGFCQVLNGEDINCRATPTEKQKITSIMNGGFYIE